MDLLYEWELAPNDQPTTATTSPAGDRALALAREAVEIGIFRATLELERRIEKLERDLRG